MTGFRGFITLSKEDRFIIGSALILFIVNNVFLSVFLSKMPGGSAAGITTIYAISLVSLNIRKFKAITLVFIIYGSIGLLSHLMAEDWMYLPRLAILIMIAALFDFLLHKTSYRATSFILGFALFVILLNVTDHGFSYVLGNFAKPVDTKGIILTLAYGYAGMIFAFATHRLIRNKRINLET